MGPSWWQILLVVVLVVLLFGRGRISEMMGDVAKGIRSFRTGLKDDEEEPTKDDGPRTIDNASGEEVSQNAKDKAHS